MPDAAQLLGVVVELPDSLDLPVAVVAHEIGLRPRIDVAVASVNEVERLAASVPRRKLGPQYRLIAVLPKDVVMRPALPIGVVDAPVTVEEVVLVPYDRRHLVRGRIASYVGEVSVLADVQLDVGKPLDHVGIVSATDEVHDVPPSTGGVAVPLAVLAQLLLAVDVDVGDVPSSHVVTPSLSDKLRPACR